MPPRPTKEAMLAKIGSATGLYECSRLGLEHSLHCNRVLRDRTDGLREFKDLPAYNHPKKLSHA